MLDIGSPVRWPGSIFFNVLENFWTVCVLSESDPAVLSVAQMLILRLCQLNLLEYTATFETSLKRLPTIEEVEQSFRDDESDDGPYRLAILPAMDWPQTLENNDMEVIQLGWTHVLSAVERLPKCLACIALMGCQNIDPWSILLVDRVSE